MACQLSASVLPLRDAEFPDIERRGPRGSPVLHVLVPGDVGGGGGCCGGGVFFFLARITRLSCVIMEALALTVTLILTVQSKMTVVTRFDVGMVCTYLIVRTAAARSAIVDFGSVILTVVLMRNDRCRSYCTFLLFCFVVFFFLV